jgi:flagellar biosynthesis protein
MAEPKLPQRAVALRYDTTRDAVPRVVAKGKGAVAERIVSLAKANHVPVREDPNLIQILGRVDLDREIPPVVYHAVAAILSFLYKVNRTPSA